MLDKLRAALSGTADGVRAEADVDIDPARVDSRATGNLPNASELNQGSTTSASQSGGYVGRIAGDDVGYAGETGAERRAETERGTGQS